MSRRAFWLTFFGFSVLYRLFVFPNALEGLSLTSLLSVVRGSPTSFASRAYLPIDSATYLQLAAAPLRSILALPTSSAPNLALFNNVLPLLIGKFALVISPARPLLFVAALNHAAFVWTIAHYRAICRYYKVSVERFLPLLMLNPLILFSMYTLNKEVLGLFIAGALVRYALEGRRVSFSVMLLIALLTRNVFFIFGLILLGRRLIFRTRPYVMLTLAALVVPIVLWATHNAPLGNEFGSLDLLTTALNQQTSSVLVWAFNVSRVPFGYIVTYPVVTAINLLSPLLNPQYYAEYVNGFNWSQAALQCSSLAFAGILVATTKWTSWRSLLQIAPLRLAFAITLFMSAYPLSQHRYLLPFYPLVALGYLVARSTRERFIRASLTPSPQASGRALLT